MRILLVEDSKRLREALQLGLQRLGYAVDAVEDGRKGLSYAANNPYDVVVLDLMLPALDGLEVLRTLRAQGSATHVLILSARDTLEDRLEGLRAGADDYLVKPFAFAELVERIRALLRRRYDRKDPVVRVGGLVLEPDGLHGEEGLLVPLTRREHALLDLLSAHAGNLVSREAIEDALYGEHDLPEGNAVQTLVSRVRGKLREVEGGPRIATIRGRGYRLVEPRP